MAYYGFVPPQVGYPRAREAADKAPWRSIRISRMPMPRWRSGTCSGGLDWPAAEREFTHAL